MIHKEALYVKQARPEGREGRNDVDDGWIRATDYGTGRDGGMSARERMQYVQSKRRVIMICDDAKDECAKAVMGRKQTMSACGSICAG